MMIGYARVSTKDQSLDLQIDALKEFGAERIYQEKQSGSLNDRQELQKALDSLREGDTFIVYKLDRLARSTLKLLKVSEQLEESGVELISIKDNIDTTSPMGKAMFRMLSVLAELERDMIRERTRAGLDAARSRGRTGGRPKAKKEKVEKAVKMYRSKSFTIREISEVTGVSSATIYRYLKENSNEQT